MTEMTQTGEPVAVSATTTPPVDAKARNRRKTREGVVVSDGMTKTVIVAVRELKPHPLYKKVVQHRAHFKAHDEHGECRVGDRVRIMETRPISKDKRWRVAEILEKAK
jgi:small subunit ribosomal protein S17